MDPSDAARMIGETRLETYRLRESLISAIQAIASVAQAVEEIQDAISASDLRGFVRPETKEHLGDASGRLVEALKGLMDEAAQQSIDWGDGNAER